MAASNHPENGAGSGAMSRALDDYDQETRQRRYMIEELEATVENLETELAEWKEKNKDLEGECEKLQIAAEGAEANYEKKVKEKALMENELRELSKEMEHANAMLVRKRTGLQQLKLLHKQKVDLCKKKEEEYLKQYMKNPKIAKVLENTKKAQELEANLKQKQAEVKRRLEEKEKLKAKHDEEWGATKKKIVKLAEMDEELKKKKAASQNRYGTLPLQSKDKIAGSSSRFGAGLPNAPFRMDRLGSKLGIAVPPQRRSSAFQQLDRLLDTSTRRATLTGSPSWKNLCSPLNGGPSSPNRPSLVSQIRSKLNKGTVTVYPMPRSQEAREQVQNMAPSTATLASEARERDLAIEPTVQAEARGTSSNEDGFLRPRTPARIPTSSEPMETSAGDIVEPPPLDKTILDPSEIEMTTLPSTSVAARQVCGPESSKIPRPSNLINTQESSVSSQGFNPTAPLGKSFFDPFGSPTGTSDTAGGSQGGGDFFSGIFSGGLGSSSSSTSDQSFNPFSFV